MANLKLSVNRLREGMVIKSDVYNRMGMAIVMEGTIVTKDVINMLTRHFIDSVVVEYGTERSEENNKPEKTASEEQQQFEAFRETFQNAEQELSDSLKEIVNREKDVDIPQLLGTIDTIVAEADSDSNLMQMLYKMKDSKGSLYRHALNVAVLGQMLARWCNCRKEEIEQVVIAALLHDIGMLDIPKEKMEKFTYRGELETTSFERHVISGYNILKEQNIPYSVKQAVLTHHERLDGNGYPLKVPYNNINKISRMVAIADTYDTLTMKREGEANLSVYEAIARMEEEGFHKLDFQFLTTFMTHVVESTIRHKVQLNDGREGEVVMINKYNLSRPLIKTADSFVDLAKDKQLSIWKMID